ncbi:MAG: cysteine desulfurase, partial [Ignavibacteria bacterium]|nr:cysteine desulfurase [Ignavibacteria bacterium]
FFTEKFGNAASKHHRYGIEALAVVEHARKSVAALIGAEPSEIIWTSGATESINLAIKGVTEANFTDNANIVVSEIEHPAVLDTCSALSKAGIEIRKLKVNGSGIVDINELERQIDNNTLLVSVMTANNEIGTIQPVAEIGKICSEKNVLFHTDATQAYGKISLNVKELNIDLMSFSAHKLYGPKGAGALYIKNKNPRINITPQNDGGGHERGLRSGTLNVPAIAGFGKCAEIAGKRIYDDFNTQTVLRDRLIENIIRKIPGTKLNGHRTKRLPNNLNICFEGVDAGALISELKNIAVSAGSACSSATLQPSHVLKAIGMQDEDIRSSVRFGIGRMTTDEDVDYAVNKLVKTINKLRNKK